MGRQVIGRDREHATIVQYGNANGITLWQVDGPFREVYIINPKLPSGLYGSQRVVQMEPIFLAVI